MRNVAGNRAGSPVPATRPSTTICQRASRLTQELTACSPSHSYLGWLPQAIAAETLLDLALPVSVPPHITPSQDQRDNIAKYKYELIGDSYRPHITLGRLRPHGQLTVWPLTLPDFSFRPDHLLVGEADDQDSVRTVWAERDCHDKCRGRLLQQVRQQVRRRRRCR
jgi:hypothetical protein